MQIQGVRCSTTEIAVSLLLFQLQSSHKEFVAFEMEVARVKCQKVSKIYMYFYCHNFKSLRNPVTYLVLQLSIQHFNVQSLE